MRFDAARLALAWLSVAQASGSDTTLPTLDRTVALELYDDGVRLLATDRYILLAELRCTTGRLIPALIAEHGHGHPFTITAVAIDIWAHTNTTDGDTLSEQVRPLFHTHTPAGRVVLIAACMSSPRRTTHE